MGTARAEYEAAYFTMLRAIEERDGLVRYREYLHEELDRLGGFVAQTETVAESVPARVRKPVDRTTRPLVEAVQQREAVIRVELGLLDERVEAAEAFVRECEEEVAALRS